MLRFEGRPKRKGMESGGPGSPVGRPCRSVTGPSRPHPAAHPGGQGSGLRLVGAGLLRVSIGIFSKIGIIIYIHIFAYFLRAYFLNLRTVSLCSECESASLWVSSTARSRIKYCRL